MPILHSIQDGYNVPKKNEIENEGVLKKINLKLYNVQTNSMMCQLIHFIRNDEIL